MSVQSQITRIQTARNTIRTKLNNFGLVETTADIENCAEAINGITNKGNIEAEVKEGESYTIQTGYYQGGTVKGVAGGGNYSLQAKTVTPIKTQQVVASDEGYYGLSSVTVNPIPEVYQDVSSVNATAGDVLANKLIVTKDGTLTAGTMINNGAVSKSLNAGESYTVPVGYHNGLGKITANSLASQTVGTATATDILDTKIAWVGGLKITGSMPNNGDVSGTIIGLQSTQTTISIPAGYTSGGTISLTQDIEDALATI